MELTDEEKKMYNGEMGPGVQKAMTLLVKFGTVFGAERLVKADIVHISSNIPTDMLQEMTEGADKARSQCSLHAVYDPTRFGELGIRRIKKGQTIGGGIVSQDPKKYKERLEIFKRLGFFQTFTCLPYAIGIVPKQGDVVIMTGSAGQIASNSIFGARANREAASSALATAVTGKTPYMGFLRPENRSAQVLVQVKDLDSEGLSTAHYGALGYYVGGIAVDRNVVISGLPEKLSIAQLRFLTSPMPVSGAVTLCHVVGVTPEAPTLERALGGRKPERTVVVGKKEVEEAWEKLHTADTNQVDLVIIGCPHASIFEIREIASLLEGKRLSKSVRLNVGASMPVYALGKRMGFTDIVEKAGGVFAEYCVGAANPLFYLGDTPRTVATNSARSAHYIVRLTGGKTKVLYGTTKSCIEAGITGKWGSCE